MNERLTLYRKRKKTNIIINHNDDFEKGDLSYEDMGDNKGRLERCTGFSQHGHPTFARIRHPYRHYVPTYDYATGTLYWFDAGRYNEISPFPSIYADKEIMC